jgi:hypothetical protein
MDGPTESVWRAQQEAAARFADGWRALLESTAGRTTGAGASAGLPDPLQVLTRSAADYAAVAIQPLRDLADGQRDFADQMTRWAELPAARSVSARGHLAKPLAGGTGSWRHTWGGTPIGSTDRGPNAGRGRKRPIAAAASCSGRRFTRDPARGDA